MSIYKGKQLIATNGMPGRDGRDGRDGIDAGLQIVSSFTELHNNINSNGNIEQTNKSLGANWCSVGGYRCGVQGGQGAIVYGYNCVGTGSGTAVFGYGNTGNDLTLGILIEGYENRINGASQGMHIEGWQNDFTGSHVSVHPGVHVEGAKHTTIVVNTEGAHQGGCGITNNTPGLRLSHQRPGYQSGIIEAIGLPDRGPNGEYARIVRADGSMAINGDMSFIATRDDGGPEVDANHPVGVYTLGEIVKALHNANITIPKIS